MEAHLRGEWRAHRPEADSAAPNKKAAPECTRGRLFYAFNVEGYAAAVSRSQPVFSAHATSSFRGYRTCPFGYWM